jgi:glutaryl-CoA dehydrogenase
VQNYRGLDYFNIESLLSEEEIMVRDSVRDFVSNEIIPIIEKYNRESKFPINIILKMAELGLFGTTLPQNMAALLLIMLLMD